MNLRFFKLCIVLVGLALPFHNSFAAPVEVVGALPGEVVVDNTGKANFSIPIAVAPGTGGLQPNISLIYSSQSGNGPLGVGWSIGGLSTISRGAKTYFNDGGVEGVQFDNKDPFYLDGQRLILVSGSNGVAGSEYRTEVDAFARIRYIATNTWTVEGKDGLTLTFGVVENCLIEHQDSNASSHDKVFSWSVYKIEDTVGNYMLFQYENESRSEGKNRIRRIVYTGNSNASIIPYAAVEFNYESTVRPDVITGYALGSPFVQENRLSNIALYTNGNYSNMENPSTKGSFVRQFNFAYKTSSITSRSLLDTVQLFSGGSYSLNGSSAAGKMPKTQVFYQSESETLDFVQHGTDTVPGWDVDNSWSTIDIDGDGIPEIAKVTNDINGNRKVTFRKTYELNGHYFVNNTALATVTTASEQDEPVSFGDFNGDGFIDIISYVDVVATGSIQAEVFDCERYTGGEIEQDPESEHVFFNQQAIKYSDIELQIQYGNGAGQFLINSDSELVFRFREFEEIKSIDTGDFDADGRQDILVFADTKRHTQRCNTFFDGKSIYQLNSGTNFEIPHEVYTEWADDQDADTVLVGDYNGDGRSDFVLNDRSHSESNDTYTQYFEVFLSESDPENDVHNVLTQQYSDWRHLDHKDLSQSDNEGYYRVFSGDFNGDGSTDLMVRYIAKTSGSDYIYYQILLSNGSDAFIPQAITRRPESWNVNFSPDEYVIDANGDGYSDLAGKYFNNSNWTIQFEFRLCDGKKLPKYATVKKTTSDAWVKSDRFKYKIQPSDVRGSGLPDFLTVSQFSNNTRFQFWGVDSSAPDLATEFRSGVRDNGQYGDYTKLTFTPITDDSIYVKGSGALYPVMDIQAPINVVSQLSKNDGRDNDKTTLYSYADARMHVKGRGFLGFRIFESYDINSGMTQKQILAQDFPLTGMQISVENYYNDDPTTSGDALLSQIRNVLLVDTVNDGVNENLTWFPMVVKSEEKVFTPGSSNAHSTTSTVSLFDNYQALPADTDPGQFDFSDIDEGAFWDDVVLTEGSSLGIDPLIVMSNLPGRINYGNIKQTISTFGNPGDDDFRRLVTINKVANNVTKWFLGRVSFMRVYGYLPNQINTTISGKNTSRYTEFNYDINSGLIKSEKIWESYDDGDGEGDWLKTTHNRLSNIGTINQTTISGSDITERITLQITDWDSYYRFPEVLANTLGHEETKEYNQVLGVVTKHTGPNGIVTEWDYDSFGVVTAERTNAGTVIEQEVSTGIYYDSSVTIPAYTDNNSVTHPAITSYTKQVSIAPASPVSTVYYDKIGREIRSEVEDMVVGGSRKVRVDKIYSTKGEIVAESVPYFSDEGASHWNESYFDDFGRPLSTIASDDTTSEVEYYVTTEFIPGAYRAKTVSLTNTTNQGPVASHSQSVTTFANSWGEKGQVIDDHGNKINYLYDGHANLIQTKRVTADGSPTVTTDIVYNNLGQKVGMYDEDMAPASNTKWEYEYNVTGELLSQTDPKGQTVTMAYDKLGRLTAKNYVSDGKHYRYYYDLDSELQGRKGVLRLLVETDSSGNEITNGYRESYHFDEFGRPNLTLTRTDGQYYYNYVRYDNLGRVTDTDYFWRPSSVTDDSSYAWLSFGLTSSYNSLSFNTGVYDRSGAGLVNWWFADPSNVDAQGRLTEYTNGNGTTVVNTFDANDLYLDESILKNSGGTALIKRKYDFDNLGNVTKRKDLLKGITENALYDDLNRLTNWNISGSGGSASNSASYNDLGNIVAKTGFTGTLGYGNSAGPHAVTSYTKNGSSFTIQYDNNGNMIQRKEGTNAVWSASWTQFNKVKDLYLNGGDFESSLEGVRFTYGAENQRLTEITREGGSYTKKQRYLGVFEQTLTAADQSGNNWTLKHTKINVGGYGLYTYDHQAASSASSPVSRVWLHKDHIGSIVGITDKFGALIEERAYDAWGKELDPTDWIGDPSTEFDEDITDRGYTGHEMIKAVGLINMNGRIYDPELGRFLSPDTVVQFPENFQSYNRYTYVNNNPISFNDPSGHFISILVGIALKYYGVTSLTAQIIATSLATVAQVLIEGGSIEDALKAGAFAALSAMVSFQVGNIYGHDPSIVKDTLIKKSLTLNEMARAATHGIVQGGIAELQGGDFGSTFLSAAAGSTAGSLMGNRFGNAGDKEGVVTRTVAAAIVGGTTSELAGGKFANGAMTAAIVHLFNNEAVTQSRERREQLLRAKRAAKHYSRNAENDQFTMDEGIHGRDDLTINEVLNAGDYGMKQASAKETKFHRQGEGNGNNIKLTSKVAENESDYQKDWSNRYGRYEVILRPNGDGTYTHVLDPVNMGTLNRGNNPLTHYDRDIAPYLVYGNVLSPEWAYPEE